jgi:hypothetical protein
MAIAARMSESDIDWRKMYVVRRRCAVKMLTTGDHSVPTWTTNSSGMKTRASSSSTCEYWPSSYRCSVANEILCQLPERHLRRHDSQRMYVPRDGKFRPPLTFMLADDGSIIAGLQALDAWHEDLNYPSATKIGLLNACGSFSGIVAGPLIAYIDERFGRRWGIRCE